MKLRKENMEIYKEIFSYENRNQKVEKAKTHQYWRQTGTQ